MLTQIITTKTLVTCNADSSFSKFSIYQLRGHNS